MSNETVVRNWQTAIIRECKRILKRELTSAEMTFITSRSGFIALEMIHDHVRSLDGNAEELQLYLRSETSP